MNNCHLHASCMNTQGSYNCSCNPKYIGDGYECESDPCHDYKDLNDSDRNSSIKGNLILCDKELPNGWYRFMGAAGTKMPTARVEPNHCGTRFSGWLDGVHPRVEHGEVTMKVCFSGLYRKCRDTTNILVKNCGSYYIYRHLGIQSCPRRYCGTE
ncbi:uromodulin-like [Stylophora pistillata]|uniref:uromodulin-like n=1 Tax=Stylophora pistillata TaxID=50429 RepID=UPI000C047A14|nr:uromodulin-like [Stylophora pistillata]